MAPEPISTAYFINPSHQSVSLCILDFVARQPLGKHDPTATNTRKYKRIVGRVSVGLSVYPLAVARKQLGKDSKELLEASFSMRAMSYQREEVD
jgi:hypothetical protein